MGGIPEVRWGEYEQSVIHVRTSHVPRFEIELPPESGEAKESLFKQMGIRYDDFRKLDMQDMCRHEVTRDFLADNLMNLEKLPKTS